MSDARKMSVSRHIGVPSDETDPGACADQLEAPTEADAR